MRQYGEVAPLPEFGTESLDEARQFLDKLEQKLTKGKIESAIKDAPPASAFGMWAASSEPVRSTSVASSALISLGEFSRENIESLSARGFESFKIKVGSDDPEKTWRSLESVLASLSTNQTLRLDPNRSWNKDLWAFWKPRLAKVSAQVEYLEEPFLPETPMDEWIHEAADSPVPLALDESLSNGSIKDWYDHNWPGYWIIKPSLLGRPSGWLSLLDKHKGKVILSSAFETGIGLSSLVMFSRSLSPCIHGLGTQEFFDDEMGTKKTGAIITCLSLEEQEEIWNRLSKN